MFQRETKEVAPAGHLPVSASSPPIVGCGWGEYPKRGVPWQPAGRRGVQALHRLSQHDADGHRRDKPRRNEHKGELHVRPLDAHRIGRGPPRSLGPHEAGTGGGRSRAHPDSPTSAEPHGTDRRLRRLGMRASKAGDGVRRATPHGTSIPRSASLGMTARGTSSRRKLNFGGTKSSAGLRVRPWRIIVGGPGNGNDRPDGAPARTGESGDRDPKRAGKTPARPFMSRARRPPS